MGVIVEQETKYKSKQLSQPLVSFPVFSQTPDNSSYSQSVYLAQKNYDNRKRARR